MALLAAVLKETFGDEPCGAIWPLLDADNLIFVTSLLAISHSCSSVLLVRRKTIISVNKIFSLKENWIIQILTDFGISSTNIKWKNFY